MRVKFQTLERAKKAAKALAALTHGVKLSTAQLVIARIAGFRDWHDLAENLVEGSTATAGSTQDDLHSETTALSAALVLAKELGLPFGEALARRRANEASRTSNQRRSSLRIGMASVAPANLPGSERQTAARHGRRNQERDSMVDGEAGHHQETWKVNVHCHRPFRGRVRD